MKPTIVIMMAAALLAGNTLAQTTEPADLLQRVGTLNKQSLPSPREVADTLVAAKAATPTPWNEGDNLTYEQKFQNELIAGTTELMARKVSFATAFDYAKARAAWHLAYIWADRMGDRDEALTCVGKWVQAAPTVPVRNAELLHLRAKYGQDVRTDVEALFRDHRDLTHYTAWRLAAAWQRSAEKAGALNAESFNVLLASAVDSVVAADKPQTRVSAVLMRSTTGQNVNAEIMTMLAGTQGTLPLPQASALFDAFSLTTATNEETLAFYDALLRSVEANAKSAPFLRKILDQKLKLQ